MSDSDSTIPATDDFGSRFLEFDEYSEEQTEEEEICSVASQFHSPSNLSSVSGPVKPGTSRRSDTLKIDTLGTRRNSSQRGRRRSCLAIETKSEAIDDDDDDDADDNDEAGDEEFSKFRNPKLLTARQMSLKSQRNSSSGKKTSVSRTHTEPTLLSLESLETPKSEMILTPEQVAAHQRRVAHRRETAKHKAELEKRQTVERLLKINANSIGRRGRRRGRNARGLDLRSTHPSSSSLADTNDSITSVNEGSPESSEMTSDQKINPSIHSSDPAPVPDKTDESSSSASNRKDSSEVGPDKRTSQANKNDLLSHIPNPNAKYIRTISSNRLNPSKLVCFPQINDSQLEVSTNLWTSKPVSSIPPSRLCDLGCGRVRRYACAKTGRSLCSLACYKQNLSLVV